MSATITTTPDTGFDPAAVQALATIEQSAALAFVEANKVAVVDLATLARAKEVRAAIGDRQKEILVKLAKPKAWAFGLHKWFCSLEAASLVQYEILDGYEREQIRLFDAEQTRRREERERVIAEAHRKADEARATHEAAALESAGEHDLAARVLAEQIDAPPPVVVLPDEVRAVQRFRRTWKCQVINAALVPREFLQIDQVKLNRYATNMKETASVAGVRFFYVDEPIR